MEIEVGEYVRTPIGIFIISHINIDFDDNDKNKCLLCQNEKNSFLSIDIIKKLKHSKNIIDLVEVRDYVNGQEVIEVREQEGKIYLMTGYVPQTYIKEKIKSIVTHEQFASIEYKVEEGK